MAREQALAELHREDEVHHAGLGLRCAISEMGEEQALELGRRPDWPAARVGGPWQLLPRQPCERPPHRGLEIRAVLRVVHPPLQRRPPRLI